MSTPVISEDGSGSLRASGASPSVRQDLPAPVEALRRLLVHHSNFTGARNGGNQEEAFYLLHKNAQEDWRFARAAFDAASGAQAGERLDRQAVIGCSPPSDAVASTSNDPAPPVVQLAARVESIILRRLYSQRIDGYTLEMSREIVATLGSSDPIRAELVEALREIESHWACQYDHPRKENAMYAGPYGIGVTDGHRAAASIARKALAKASSTTTTSGGK